MNPTTSHALDPKLKEVYDRVMGTSVASSPPKPQATPQVVPTTQNSQVKPAVQANTLPQQGATVGPHSIPDTSSVQPDHKNVPPPRPASLAGTPQPKSAVDYAALAAKYATPPTQPQPSPQPFQQSVSAPSSPTPTQNHSSAAVTPSSTTYGVVNGGTDSTTKSKTDSDSEPEQKGSMMKKLLLIAGILMFFVLYTFVWIVVFGFELPI